MMKPARVINVERIIPCIADPLKVRVICHLDSPINDLNKFATLVGGRYAPGLGVVTVNVGMHQLCFYASGKVTITKVDDVKEAIKLVESLITYVEHRLFLELENK